MLQIDYEIKKPIYQKIYEQIKHNILVGNLSVGTRITSTRALARELHLYHIYRIQIQCNLCIFMLINVCGKHHHMIKYIRNSKKSQ